jgi:hypothetical protein
MAGLLHPERALRMLDTLDSAAYAARLVCAGYIGSRLLRCLTAVLGLLAPLPLLLF